MIGTAHETTRAVAALRPQTMTLTANGLVVDTQGGFEEALIALNVGAVGGTSPTLDVKVQEGDASNLSDAADVTGAVFTQKASGQANNEYTSRLNLKGRKRYLRLVFTLGGTSPSFALDAVFALSAARELPVSQVNGNEFSV